jgi:hypothetical protein
MCSCLSVSRRASRVCLCVSSEEARTIVNQPLLWQQTTITSTTSTPSTFMYSTSFDAWTVPCIIIVYSLREGHCPGVRKCMGACVRTAQGEEAPTLLRLRKCVHQRISPLTYAALTRNVRTRSHRKLSSALRLTSSARASSFASQRRSQCYPFLTLSLCECRNAPVHARAWQSTTRKPAVTIRWTPVGTTPQAQHRD